MNKISLFRKILKIICLILIISVLIKLGWNRIVNFLENKRALSLGEITFSDLKTEGLKTTNSKIDEKMEVQDEVMNYRLRSKERIIQIQKTLKKIGFYNGEINGNMGPQTRTAVKAFQKSKGLNPDGIVGPQTWGELNKCSGDKKGE